jgi:hypothetical protein
MEPRAVAVRVYRFSGRGAGVLWKTYLLLRTESIFMQPNRRRVSRAIVNGQDIETARAIAGVTFGEKTSRGAN